MKSTFHSKGCTNFEVEFSVGIGFRLLDNQHYALDDQKATMEAGTRFTIRYWIFHNFFFMTPYDNIDFFFMTPYDNIDCFFMTPYDINIIVGCHLIIFRTLQQYE